MLSKISRFRGHNSLRAIYKYGKSVNGSQISLRYLENKTSKPSRVAVVVSRKVNKRAVVRNRIRRRIYEQIRVNTQGKSLDSDIAIIVYGDQYANMTADELNKAMSELLNKSRVIEKK